VTLVAWAKMPRSWRTNRALDVSFFFGAIQFDRHKHVYYYYDRRGARLCLSVREREAFAARDAQEVRLVHVRVLPLLGRPVQLCGVCHLLPSNGGSYHVPNVGNSCQWSMLSMVDHVVYQTSSNVDHVTCQLTSKVDQVTCQTSLVVDQVPCQTLSNVDHLFTDSVDNWGDGLTPSDTPFGFVMERAVPSKPAGVGVSLGKRGTGLTHVKV
jgi:hypothetical protein